MISLTRNIICLFLFTIASSMAYAENQGIAGREGNHFTLNGSPFYYAGANNYYQMVYAADPNLRYAVDEIQEEIAALGMNVLRTWAFNDGESQWNALQTSPRIYNEYVFEGLDYVLNKADEQGLRLILPFVNNWDDYGGMNQYVAWSPTADSHDDFYSDDSCKIWYKNHIAAVLNRVNTINGRIYKEDPTVFAWELGNELRCSSDPAGNTLQAWTEEMADYIKSIDSVHMVTTGSEGFYGTTGPAHNPVGWFGIQGVDFIRNHEPTAIDFAVLHAWPDWWGIDYNTAMLWLNDHIDDTDDLLGKPVVLEEYGKHQPIATRNQFFQGWLDTVYAGASAGKSAAGSNLWILYHDDYPDYDGFGIYFPADSSTIQVLKTHANEMNILSGLFPEPEVIFTPVNPPIIVSPGDHFFFDATVINHFDTSITLDCGIGLILPGNTFYGLLEIYNDVSFPANDTVAFTSLRQDIPWYAMLGEYQYVGYIGEYPEIIDSSYFPFTIVDGYRKIGKNSPMERWFAPNVQPSSINIFENYPNPFNAITTISFDIVKNGNVNLSVYNLMGQRVETLFNGRMQKGQHNITWDASTYSSGIYFYKLTTRDSTFTKRMTLLK
ncbi:MAG: T9SS type A sorting domain-containing protein [candidate division Zixibacteria bacterium]|nr:T9SS type A sorting domain-containing protein [candidate division Zixibacteria bacterium]